MCDQYSTFLTSILFYSSTVIQRPPSVAPAEGFQKCASSLLHFTCLSQSHWWFIGIKKRQYHYWYDHRCLPQEVFLFRHKLSFLSFFLINFIHNIHNRTGLENHSNGAQRVNNTLLFHLFGLTLTRGCFSQPSSCFMSWAEVLVCMCVYFICSTLQEESFWSAVLRGNDEPMCITVSVSAWESTGQSQLTVGGILRLVHTRLFSRLHFFWSCLWPLCKENRRWRCTDFIKWMKSISEAREIKNGEEVSASEVQTDAWAKRDSGGSEVWLARSERSVSSGFSQFLLQRRHWSEWDVKRCNGKDECGLWW